MTSRGVLYVDETVDEYLDVRLPPGWVAHFEPRWGSLQASMSHVFERFPNARSYGWLADDTVPRTPGWDALLEESAGRFGFAHANDDWHSHDPTNRYEFERGDDMSAGLCWGGDLVRAVGWWALPGLRQAGIDTAWTAMLGPLGLTRYRHDVVVEHKHYRTGKRAEDAGDAWVRDGIDYVQADIDARDRWVASQDFIDTVVRVARRFHVEPDRPWLCRTLVEAKAGRLWTPAMPAARMANMVRAFEVEVGELVCNVLGAHTDPQPSRVP